MLTVPLRLPPELEAELRRSAKARRVLLAQEITDRLRLSLIDVTTETLQWRVAGGEEED